MTDDQVNKIILNIGDWLASGQGSRDFGSPLPQWKIDGIKDIIKDLTPEEKKEVWDHGRPWPIGTGDGDGTFPEHEVRFIAEVLGVKIKIKPAEVIEEL